MNNDIHYNNYVTNKHIVDKHEAMILKCLKIKEDLVSLIIVLV